MTASTNDYELQRWLIGNGQPIALDGIAGAKTRGAIMAEFVNLKAPAIARAQEQAFADQLGVSLRQLRAVAEVESDGGGFDSNGRPKILFERHIFHRMTGGRHSVTAWSNPKAGGYSEDSWDKLCAAACADFWAAFSSASWGKMQVMGMHWQALAYETPHEMAWSMTGDEAAHYDAMVRYITANDLTGAMRAISADPDDCRAFARGYNGSGYEAGGYHIKIAKAVAG